MLEFALALLLILVLRRMKLYSIDEVNQTKAALVSRINGY